MQDSFRPVPNHPRYEINALGIIRNAGSGKVKSQYVGSTGYYMVSFSYGNESKPQRVHRLLADAFIPNPKALPCVNHRDGVKTNNSLDNLEWVTHTENMRHAFGTGLANNTGERNGQSKLTPESVAEIKQLMKDGISQYEIARMYSVSRTCISGISTGRLWRHV